MKPALVILVDDQAEGFWSQLGWTLDWTESLNYSFEFVRELGFRLGDDAAGKLGQRLNDRFGADWHDRFHESIFVVTDSYIESEPAGGAQLLRQMQRVPRLQWRRAVVYSEEPRLDEVPESSRLHVRAVFKRHASDERSIRVFFDTGIFPSLDPIWAVFGELKTLHLCCQTAWSRIQRGQDILLSAVSHYGHSDESMIDARYAFDPALAACAAHVLTVFSQESAHYFAGTIQAEFEAGLAMAERLKLWSADPREPSVTSAWHRLCLSLHPIESLDQRSPIRRLWECVQTGGESSWLDDHPAVCDVRLSARERCWVKNRILKLVNNTRDESSIGHLVHEALVEHQWIAQAGQAIAEAQSWERNR